MTSTTQLIHQAKRIRALSHQGLTYAKDPYDQERYTELQEISFQILQSIAQQPIETVRNFFSNQKEYPTPKVDVRAIVLNPQGEILMVKESTDGLWSLPGGWADIGFSPSEVAIKEVHEETGLTVKVNRLIALLDKRLHPHPPQPEYVYKLFIACDYLSGNLQKSFDILDIAYFPTDALPPLSENRVLKPQITEVVRRVKENILEVWLD